MKTLLKYDLRIQQTLILLFIASVLTALLLKQEYMMTVLIIEFFLIAFFQYVLNTVKFCNVRYTKTASRKIYIFTSTYIVIGFLIWILMCMVSLPPLDTGEAIRSIFEYMVISWTMLSPVLILQSLSISFSDHEDTKNRILKKCL